MLKNIPSILSPELLKTLCEMGHSDRIVIADGNFPAESMGRNCKVIRADGHGVPGHSGYVRRVKVIPVRRRKAADPAGEFLRRNRGIEGQSPLLKGPDAAGIPQAAGVGLLPVAADDADAPVAQLQQPTHRGTGRRFIVGGDAGEILKAQLRRKAQSSEHSQRVLTKSHVRVAD